jgi:hypothetical protein
MRSRTKSALIALTVVLAPLVSAPRSARADMPVDPAAPPVVDVPVKDPGDRYKIDRTWLYADDARVPDPLVIVAMANSSYTNVGSNPFHIDGSVTVPTKYTAFDGNTAQPGVMMSVGGELGLFPRVSVMALGELAVGGETSHPNGGAIAGVRFLVTPPSWTHLHIVASAGYLREAWEGPIYDDDTGKWNPGNPNGDNGMWFQGAISGDIGRLRMVGNFHGEHVFSDGRDPLDIMVDLGATYRLIGELRAGAEWIGQDLEETFSPGAEGGARMFFGPIASYQFVGDRLTLVGGPAIGFSQAPDQAPNFIGRLALAYGF